MINSLLVYCEKGDTYMDNQNTTLASEMLSELKANNKRLFIALIVVLAGWFLTIGGFIVYLSLPVEEVTVEQEVDGDTNHLIGIGDNYVGEADSNLSQETVTP